MRAALYARVSTQEQGEGYSIPSQIALMRQYAEERGYRSVAEYIDIGHSGGTTDRPQLAQMLIDAQDREFDVVISKNPDRLARGVEVFIPIETILKEARCKIEFVEGQYRDDPMSQAMLQIRQVMAGFERKLIGIRVHAGRVQKAKEGKVNAHPQPLYGYSYDSETDSYVINPEEARWVTFIFERYIERWRPRAIADHLNKLGIPTKTGSALGWSPSNITEKMIKQTAYYGEGWANRYVFVKGERTKGVKGRTEQRPREEWIAVKYPPIIDRETFEKAQAQRQRNKSAAKHNRARPEYALAGRLWCAECGMKFLVRTIQNERTKGRVYRYYKCGGMIRYPHLHTCRPKPLVRAESVEDAVRQVTWDAIVS